MKAPSQESGSTTDVKSAELVVVLNGLRLDPSILSQSHEILGETMSSCSPLNEGVRARIRLRNNPEVVRFMMRSQSLRVSTRYSSLKYK